MSEKPTGYYDLVERFPASGCAVCRLVLRDGERSLKSLMHEYVMDFDTQADFRRSRGLCNHHAWWLSGARNALGVAKLYSAALDEIINTLDSVTDDGQRTLFSRLLNGDGNRSALADALRQKKPCPVCALQSANEARYLKTLCKYIKDERMNTAYRASDGLCLTHFRGALNAAPSAATHTELVTIQRDIWHRLYAELNEFMRKSDVYVNENFGEEGDSWLRTIASLGGLSGVFGVDRQRDDDGD
ncbi:MAG: hypothetical protein EA396_02175 [Anaerolineaceae bacterium]|nr:MAG: hypothetical protein EA396_02175 [Anaerolineaceae bacterium]